MTEQVYEKHDPYSLADWQRYLSHAEIDLLHDLTMSLPKSPRIANLGAGGGTSGLTFISARPDVYLYTVDIVLEPNPYGGLSAEMGILKAAGWLDMIRYLPIHQDSVVEGKRWSRPPLDLVFVDGGHEYDECKGDIDAWWPHLKLGGVMAIHDYRKREAYAYQHPDVEITPELLTYLIKPYEGVDRATEELVASGKCEVITIVDTLIAVRKVTE